MPQSARDAMDEVDLLKVNILFDLDRYEEALEACKQVKSSKNSEEIESLEKAITEAKKEHDR